MIEVDKKDLAKKKKKKKATTLIFEIAEKPARFFRE